MIFLFEQSHHSDCCLPIFWQTLRLPHDPVAHATRSHHQSSMPATRSVVQDSRVLSLNMFHWKALS
ncbi:hypothetical protein BRADI_3g21483v3 [Brachypodium distachyon]|uniref:Uncharacterized protein n=1 Tax=Brachypodium distachyon TaxID=15368 RepID=A0A2K2CYP2_BRADI|nr:hypothetical protein BRADI_3g21483v3 [Brachypodium distachyon]